MTLVICVCPQTLVAIIQPMPLIKYNTPEAAVAAEDNILTVWLISTSLLPYFTTFVNGGLEK